MKTAYEIYEALAEHDAELSARRADLAHVIVELVEESRAGVANAFDVLGRLRQAYEQSLAVTQDAALERMALRQRGHVADYQVKLVASGHASRAGVALWRLAIYGKLELEPAELIKELKMAAAEYRARREARQLLAA